MNIVLKQKDGFTRNIAYLQSNCLEIRINNGVKIYQKNDLIFDKNFNYIRSRILSLENSKIFILDYPIIRFFDLTTKEEFVYSSEIISSASFLQMYQGNKLLLTHSEDGSTPIAPLTLCILENGIVQKLWETPPIPVKQVQIRTINGYIFVPNYELNLITTLNDSNGEILWQFDISQFGVFDDPARLEYNRKRKIKKIYYHKDKVIVTFDKGIIALHPQTGKLLWKILFDDPFRSAYNLIFNDHIAYAGYGWYYTVIDVEQGIILYKNTDPLKAIIKERESFVEYSLFRLHQGLLWGTMLSNGLDFLLKIEPSTGELVDSCWIPIKGLTQGPIFIENTIYMRDIDGNLNIFELEE